MTKVYTLLGIFPASLRTRMHARHYLCLKIISNVRICNPHTSRSNRLLEERASDLQWFKMPIFLANSWGIHENQQTAQCKSMTSIAKRKLKIKPLIQPRCSPKAQYLFRIFPNSKSSENLTSLLGQQTISVCSRLRIAPETSRRDIFPRRWLTPHTANRKEALDLLRFSRVYATSTYMYVYVQ